MNREELFKRNMLMGTEFSKQILKQPELAESLPRKANIVLLPLNDDELYKENLRFAEQFKDEDIPVVFIEIEALFPNESTCCSLTLKNIPEEESSWIP